MTTEIYKLGSEKLHDRGCLVRGQKLEGELARLRPALLQYPAVIEYAVKVGTLRAQLSESYW